MIGFNYYILVFLITHCCVNAEVIAPAQPTASAAAETLTYQIIKNPATSVGVDKVKINLGGSKYDSTKKCYLKRSNEEEIATNAAGASPQSTPAATFADIDECPGKENAAGTKCVVTCNLDTTVLPYDKLSPRTKYIYVHVGTDAATMVAASPRTEVQIFGYAIPLLANPQVSVTTVSPAINLKFETKTCTQVNCPIYYKDIKYVEGTKGTYTTGITDNVVEFDLLLPHYEMRCQNYPSFFYNMPNAYMKENIAVYKPQYYAAAGAENKVALKFTNSASSEICLFKIKGGLTADTGAYTSVCGDDTKSCYAPCKDVVLNGLANKKVYKILIQTRHHNTAVETDSDGYTQTKFAMTEKSTGLLATYTATGVTLDGTSLAPADGTLKFASCAFKHYLADKPKPNTLSGTDCAASGTPCTNTCTPQEIKTFAAGKAYMIEIAPTGTEFTGLTDFKEQIFIRTTKGANKEYVATAPTKTDSSASLTAVAGTAGAINVKGDPTCEYLVSPTGKDTFYPAKCTNSNPCRGLCKDAVTIKDLEPNTSYDIRVIADKDYDLKDYTDIKTELTTLTITHKVVLEGLLLNAKLPSKDPHAICSYTVKVKNGEEYQDAYTCPEKTPTPAPASTEAQPPAPNTTEGQPQGAPEAQAQNPVGGQPSSVPEARGSRINPRYSALNHLRASLPQEGSEPNTPSTPSLDAPITPENPDGTSGAAEKPAGDTSAPATNDGAADPAATPTEKKEEPATTAAKDPNTCSENPLCSSIMFANYDASKEYKVLITAIGKSNEIEKVLTSSAPKENPGDATKLITVSIERDGTNLIIKNKLPENMPETTKCKWELRNSSAMSRVIVKSCMGRNVDRCATFPTCTEFTIPNIADENNYHLTVYSAQAVTVFGVAEILQGAKSSARIVGLVVAVVMVAGIVGFVVFKKKND